MADSLLREWLARAGLFTGKTTRPADLEALVRALRPQPAGHALVRIGPKEDGGYLVPDDLAGLTHLFSPGVAQCSDFELDCAARGMEVFMADRSVDGPAARHPRFHFIKKFLASVDDPANGLVTLDTWCRESTASRGADAPPWEGLLQMDIEGAEYEVIHSVSADTLARFRIIVVEFHRLHQLGDRFSFRWMASALRKLLHTHAVVHLHPNNGLGGTRYGAVEIPQVMEFTFLRRDRLRQGGAPLVFPHPLDHPCVAHRPERPLPVCWRA